MNHIDKIMKKYRQMPAPAKASVWYAVCSILQKGISFVVIPIYTRILTTTEYGQYSVFQSWSNILIIFATLNLYCGVFTKAMVDRSDDRDRYTSSMQGLSTVLTTVLFLVYLVSAKLWNAIFEMSTTTMVLMFIYFIFYPSFSFWSVRQRVEYKYKMMVTVTLLVSVATPIVSILLLTFTSLRANAVIWGYMIVQIVVGGFFYIYQFVRGKVFYIKEYWVYAAKFNIPLIPHYLSLIVLGQADRIMIKEYCGDDKAGIYNLAYQVSMIMNIFVAAVNNSMVPWIYGKLKTKEYESIKDITRKLCILMAMITVGAVLVAPEIIRILGTIEYLEAVWIVPAVAISVYVTFCYGLFSNVEFYFNATNFVMIASVVGAILNIILNAVFIPACGFIAAGYTTLVCYFVFMVMHYEFMKKICRKKIGQEKVYDIKFIFISCILLCGVGGICIVLYNGWIVRYGIILTVMALLVVKRKKVIDLITMVRK